MKFSNILLVDKKNLHVENPSPLVTLSIGCKFFFEEKNKRYFYIVKKEKIKNHFFKYLSKKKRVIKSILYIFDERIEINKSQSA